MLEILFLFFVSYPLFLKAMKALGNKPLDNKAPGSEPPDDNELLIELKKLRSVLNAPGSSESKELW